MASQSFWPGGVRPRIANSHAPDFPGTSIPAQFPLQDPFEHNGSPDRLRVTSLPALPAKYGRNPSTQETSGSGNVGSVIRSPPKHKRGAMPDADHYAPPGIDTDANLSPTPKFPTPGQSKTLPRTGVMSYAAVVSKPPPVPVINDARITQKLGNTNSQNSMNSQWYAGTQDWSNTGPRDRVPSSPFPNTTKAKGKESFKSARKGNSSENKSPYEVKESPKNLRTGQNAQPSFEDPNLQRSFGNKALPNTSPAVKFTQEVREFQEGSSMRPAQSIQNKQMLPPMHVSPVASPMRSSKRAATTPNRTSNRSRNSRKDRASEDISLEEFQKKYPKTGRSDIQELQRELVKHPKGSAEGFAKIDSLLHVLNGSITARLHRVEQKRVLNTPGMSKYEETSNTEVKGLEEKKLQVERIRREYSARRLSEASVSPDGSFVSAREQISSNSSEYFSAQSDHSHPVVRLPPSAEDISRPPQTTKQADGLVRGAGDLTGGGVSSSSHLNVSFGSDSNVSQAQALKPEQATRQHRPRNPWNETGRVVDEDPEQNSDDSIADSWDSTQKKALNFDSPAFTPAGTRANHPTLSSQAAAAAPFTPRGMGALTPNLPQHQLESDPMSSLNIAHIREFTPSFDGTSAVSSFVIVLSCGDQDLLWYPQAVRS